MICDNCGQNFHASRPSQRFCERRCHMKYNARQSGRGRALVEHAMLWRLSREGHYLTEMSRMVDMWLVEDEKRVGKDHQAQRVRSAKVRREIACPLLVDR